MNSQNVDEDALDSDALQAQIDLSMSFAQGLVTSWMAPHKYTKNRMKKDLEKELTDYMRRPPRLGVGASVPEGHQNISRETARLKGKLVGSKRSAEQDEVPDAVPIVEEETESRSSAIKKKARRDPFDVVHGKKNKKQKTVEPAAVVTPGSARASGQHKNDSPREFDVLIREKESPGVPASPKSKKKKKKSSLTQLDVHLGMNDGGGIQQILASPVLENNLRKSSPQLPNEPDKEPAHEEQTNGPRTPIWTANIVTKPLPPLLSKIPLLNLTGPPSDPESEDEGATTSKKKRKRRKKKKHQNVSSTPNV